MIGFLLALAFGGLFIGALGRLVVPGPNRIGLIRTVLCGLGGSILGGLVGRLLLGWRYRYSGLLGLVLAVGFSALIVYLIDNRRRTGAGPGGPAANRPWW